MMQKPRNRGGYFLLALLLIAIGLPARLTDWYPEFMVLYVGDALWAAMIYVLLAFVFVRRVPRSLLLVAIVGTYLIEFSQLYQADWINEIRHLPFMGLILGYGFRFEDLLAYTIGIVVAWAIDRVIIWKREVDADR